jgi:hypothetical protein
MTTTFTHDAIKANPWNAVRLDIPADADLELLHAARAASVHCANEANWIMNQVREGKRPAGGMDEQYLAKCFEQNWNAALDRIAILQEMIEAAHRGTMTA